MSRRTVALSPGDFARAQAGRSPYTPKADDDELVAGIRAIAKFAGLTERATSYAIGADRLPGVFRDGGRRVLLSKGNYRRRMHELTTP